MNKKEEIKILFFIFIYSRIMIKNYATYIKEELTNPHEEGEALNYNDYYNDNYAGFKEEVLNDLKAKLIGRTINIDADREYWRDLDYNNRRGGSIKKDLYEELLSKGIIKKPIYRVTVKDVVWNGGHRQQVYWVNIIDEEGKQYRLKKIVTDKVYKNFTKKYQSELDRIEEEKRRKESLKLKHLHHDPYGEENWEEDD